jgi:hypothetical protein
MAALSTIHDVTGRRRVSSIYSWDIYGPDTDDMVYSTIPSTYCALYVQSMFQKSECRKNFHLNFLLVKHKKGMIINFYINFLLWNECFSHQPSFGTVYYGPSKQSKASTIFLN